MNVSKTVRMIIAGMVWAAVGVHLTHLAITWLVPVAGLERLLFFGIGTLTAVLIDGFGFRKIVERNVRRITSGPEKALFLSFIPLKSYLLIVLMILLGLVLRHSGIPVHYRAAIYLVMGLVLLLSSVRYGRIIITKKRTEE